MSREVNAYVAPKDDDYMQYRTVSKGAVFSLVFAILSLLGLVFPALTVFGLVAAFCGTTALVRIRRNPNELSGMVVALAGLSFGTVLFLFGVTMHTVIYLTEVPDGYQRISFADLQPSGKHLDLGSIAAKLDGHQVFIKGYVHPGISGQGKIKHFVLVRDMGTCCFGGQPKVTDMIEVTLLDHHTIGYSTRRRKLGGIFKVADEQKDIGGIQSGYYQLEADYVK